MKYYIEITLLEQYDISIYHLWSKVYTQLHLVLAEYKAHHQQQDIGTSFPEYQYHPERKFVTLGSKSRLFATTSAILEQLSLNNKLNRFSDYLHISSIRDMPQNRVHNMCCLLEKKW